MRNFAISMLRNLVGGTLFMVPFLSIVAVFTFAFAKTAGNTWGMIGVSIAYLLIMNGYVVLALDYLFNPIINLVEKWIK